MIRTRFKRVILVAPEIFPEQLAAGYSRVRHVTSAMHIFPSIHELNPDLIIFDQDYLGRDLENILRRIQTNKFYNRVKIFCYKTDPHEKTDSFLKVLGVDEFIYSKDLVTIKKGNTLFNAVHSVIDTSILKLVASVSN